MKSVKSISSAITMIISFVILGQEKAIVLYGKKTKKGAIIITTKKITIKN